MTAKKPQLEALGDFLRARRATVDPASKGMPVGERRRTPGLRREEVALLANISPSWYANLEQGRNIEPSVAVLGSIAAALDLNDFEHRYLQLLALGRAPYRDQPPSGEALALVTALVERLEPDPAYAADPFGDVVVCNRACAQWLTDFTARPPDERNAILWTVYDPEARERFADWRGEVRDVLSRYRAGIATSPDDPRVAEFLARMSRAEPDVRELWDLHEVSDISSRVRRLNHPVHGVGDFQMMVLTIGGADRLGVVIHIQMKQEVRI
ncbi:helix-turn-helix domain-containing protein [Actinospica robiniae]|uniref:helix-turn-helix domain-containing protein n=1 Tax=Actinospica robiniae TaxID=304901 RepID=UPI0007C47D89|nr:helix-turn-helix transcriptional regulator [Actinospica robiniae]